VSKHIVEWVMKICSEHIKFKTYHLRCSTYSDTAAQCLSFVLNTVKFLEEMALPAESWCVTVTP